MLWSISKSFHQTVSMCYVYISTCTRVMTSLKLPSSVPNSSVGSYYYQISWGFELMLKLRCGFMIRHTRSPQITKRIVFQLNEIEIRCNFYPDHCLKSPDNWKWLTEITVGQMGEGGGGEGLSEVVEVATIHVLCSCCNIGLPSLPFCKFALPCKLSQDRVAKLHLNF